MNKIKKINRMLSLSLILTIAVALFSITAYALSFTKAIAPNTDASIGNTTMAAGETMRVTITSNSENAPLSIFLLDSSGNVYASKRILNGTDTVILDPKLSSSKKMYIVIHNDSLAVATLLTGSYNIY